MNILGIWDGHDSGAAVIVDGQLVSALNEERLSRKKLDPAFPDRAIAACLDLAGLTPMQIDIVAASTTDVAKTLTRWVPSLKESYYQVRRRKVPPGPLFELKKRAKYWITELGPNALTKRLSSSVLMRLLKAKGFGGAKLHIFDHHHSHAIGAAIGADVDECVVVTIDGVGDGLSSTVSVWRDGSLERIAATAARDSPGIFFEHVTNLMNMRELEDEGKVMALADHTFPIEDAKNPCLDLLTVDGLVFRTKAPGHSLKGLLAKIQWALPGEQFAYMAQRTIEVRGTELVRNAVRKTGIRNVALAGGVASNVKMNHRILSLDEVDDLFVFPHMGDGGLAVGAALIAAQREGDKPVLELGELGLGPGFSSDDCGTAIAAQNLTASTPDDIYKRTAELIDAGGVVLWFTGRMEYGPRALGHRSVLARPDRTEIRDRINLVLKRRAWFQPFCPSMLENDARNLLADLTGRPNRHMTTAYSVKPDQLAKLTGVMSVDNTCRPQIVPEESDTPYAKLLRAVRDKIGVGALLNTSFNIHGEPVVCTPAEAIDVFLRSGADAIVLEDHLVEKSAS